MSALTIPSVSFRSDVLPFDEQFAGWQEQVASVFDVAPVADTDRGFPAEGDAYHVGDFVLARTRFAPQYFLRTSSRTRSDRLDHYLVQFYREGGYIGRVGEENVRVEPGSVSILDTARTLWTQATSAECLTLIVPRDIMDDVLPASGNLHGLVLPDASGGLFGDYLASLERRLPGLEVTQAPHIVRATCELLAACISPSAEHLDRARDQIEILMRRKVTRYIDKHLRSPRLTAAAISRAVGIAPAQLEALFEPLGGIEQHILSRRLERIRSEIARSTRRRSITRLAAAYGFESREALRRAFRAAFGYAPEELAVRVERDLADGGAGSGTWREGTATLTRWVRTLRR